MNKKIRVGIMGYGNLGRGVELAINQQEDMELVAVFSRRGPEGVQPVNSKVKVDFAGQAINYQDQIDIMILCGGSATDLPQQTPEYAQYFDVVDSFDNHSKIPEHFASVDQVANQHQHVAIISGGWDPGLFSLNRVIADAVLVQGETYTFWGKGLSQGHSDAVRRIKGVKYAVQYTIPSQEAIDQVRQGLQPELTTGDKHQREVYLVIEEGADKQAIEQEIVTMPGYFADYQTQVNFIDEATFKADHTTMPHGGFVIRSGQTGEALEHNQVYEFNLTLDSNPEFTASVLVALARASQRMKQLELYGAHSILDVAPAWLSAKSGDELRKNYL
ncbi:diaminopimelate dehydrogenase [Hutsoniella sourekii]